MADIFCEGNQPSWIQFLCGSENGGVIAIALVAPSVEVTLANLEDPTWWDTGLAASPQTHWIIKDTRGSRAAGTPVEEDGFGLVPTERTGDDNELVFEALGLMENREFVAATNKKRNWQLVYITAGYDADSDAYEAFYVKNVSVYMSPLIEQSIKTRKRWSGSAKWSTDMTPELPFYAPADIFTDN